MLPRHQNDYLFGFKFHVYPFCPHNNVRVKVKFWFNDVDTQSRGTLGEIRNH